MFKHSIMTPIKHIHHVHQSYHVQQSNQMHGHVIMHDLPHYITAPMHQCMFIVFIQS